MSGPGRSIALVGVVVVALIAGCGGDSEKAKTQTPAVTTTSVPVTGPMSAIAHLCLNRDPAAVDPLGLPVDLLGDQALVFDAQRAAGSVVAAVLVKGSVAVVRADTLRRARSAGWKVGADSGTSRSAQLDLLRGKRRVTIQLDAPPQCGQAAFATMSQAAG